MALIYDQYVWDCESFNRTSSLDSSGRLCTPVPMVSSPVSGYGFIGEGDAVFTTLTFRTAGSITFTLSNTVLYESSSLHEGDLGAYEIATGVGTNKFMYFELYNTGTNTLVYSKSIEAPEPCSSIDGTLTVNAAGTYDVKIRCSTSYTFYDMWDAYDSEMLTSSNINEIHVEWNCYIKAVDSYEGLEQNYVHGYLYDELGEALPGVGIALKENLSIETSTDVDGFYKLGPLTALQAANGTLVVNWLPGYETLEFPINSRTTVNIYLKLEEDEPVDPEPERPVLPLNKIVTVQNIIDCFLSELEGADFLRQMTYLGYRANQCPTQYVIKQSDLTGALNIRNNTAANANKLVKYSDITTSYTINLVDFDQMSNYYGYDEEFFYIASYDQNVWDGDIYPSASISLETDSKITGTKEQWTALYNNIFNEEAESNRVVLLSDSGQQMTLSKAFYSAIESIVNGSTQRQYDVYISEEYILTVQDWIAFVTNYSEYDSYWTFAVGITGPFLNDGDYPTSNLWYFEGHPINTIVGYIWQWQNLIDYVDYNLDGEWEYLGLAVPDEIWVDDFNRLNLKEAVLNIVNTEQNQVVNFDANIDSGDSGNSGNSGSGQYAPLTINLSDLFVETFGTNKRIYLTGDALTLDRSGDYVTCEIFSENNSDGSAVWVSEPEVGKITISPLPGENYAFYNNCLCYIKVPVVLMYSSPYVYTHIYVPIYIQNNTFVLSDRQTGLSMFSQTCKTIRINGQELVDIGDWVSVYNGLVDTAHPYGWFVDVENDAIESIVAGGSVHNYFNHCVTIEPFEDSGVPYTISLTVSDIPQWQVWRFIQSTSAYYSHCTNLIPDYYGTTVMNISTLLWYWYSILSSSYATFNLSMIPT